MFGIGHGAPDMRAILLRQMLVPIGAASLAAGGLTGIVLSSTAANAHAVGLIALAFFPSMMLVMLLLSHRPLRADSGFVHAAIQDPETGLPNRAGFDETLRDRLRRIGASGGLAVLVIDIARFKRVGETLGQDVGDLLIRQFADRLSTIVQSSDALARIGVREFAVLQSNIHSWSETEALCALIVKTMCEPFDISGHRLFVGATIGVTFAPEYGTDGGELMRKANIALNRAREEGRDCHLFFAAAMDETVKLRSQLEDGLRDALSNGRELRVYYQPKLGPGGRDIIGLEALVQWDHPRRGMITPEQFISVAEDSGLIRELGDWVLAEACGVALRWPELFVAVNLSAVQFRSTGYADHVIEIVRASGCDPRSIELEVTEGVLMDDENASRETLAKLRSAGFRIALDDFGTGASNLCYLRRFQVDKIKIDRSFTEDIGRHVDPVAIVTAVVTLGHAMGLAVTAEGIETHEQMGLLSAAGCNEFQGRFFSPAVPEQALAELIASYATDCEARDGSYLLKGALDRPNRSRRAA